MGMKKILLIGNGAREHILAATLCKNPGIELSAYMAHKNPGIVQHANKIAIGKYDNLDSIKAFAAAVSPDFAVIGPESPLASGVADMLEAQGILCVGPKQHLAQLETSKAFARQLLEKHDIPGNPLFKVFTTMEGVSAWIDDLGGYVIKADGLHGGKGVKVSGAHLQSKEEALAYAKECLASDGKIVIEEKLEGEEFSLMAFTDGATVINMPCVQDHKRAYENDEGPNTGGMGSYSDTDHALPFLTDEDIAEAMHINALTCKALAKESDDTYRGIMYGGFMVTKDGVRLIEYNARLGDPEAMNVLVLLDTDLATICDAIVHGKLADQNVRFKKQATVCKYVVPKGYPDQPEKGPITVQENTEAEYYYASVSEEDGNLMMQGSRAVSVVGFADTLADAEQIAERAAQTISGAVFHRKDIGTRRLVERRVTHMKELR